MPGSIAPAYFSAAAHASGSPSASASSALLQRDLDAVLRMDEQVVLGQETREQHAVPLVVRDLLFERGPATVARVKRWTVGVRDRPAQLRGPRAELQPERILLGKRVRRLAPHAKDIQRCAGATFGHLAGFDDGPFELLAKFNRQRRHVCTSTG
jgi:hypothetical protein